jgi:hypothetical protein
MASFWESLFGGGDKFSQKSTWTPGQQQAEQNFWQNPLQNNSTYGAGNDFLQQLLSGDPQAYAAFEKPLMENFQQNIAPGIAERFAGMGTGAGSLNSSALNNSLAQAGRGLQTDIGTLRGQLQMQALPQALQYAQQPYSNTLGGLQQRGFENFYQPGSQGLIPGVAKGLASGAGYGFGQSFGGAGMGGIGSIMNNLNTRRGVPGG